MGKKIQNYRPKIRIVAWSWLLYLKWQMAQILKTTIRYISVNNSFGRVKKKSHVQLLFTVFKGDLKPVTNDDEKLRLQWHDSTRSHHSSCSLIGCCFRNRQSHYHRSIPLSNQRRGSAPRRQSSSALSQSYSPISVHFSRRASSRSGRRDEAPDGECLSLLCGLLMSYLHEFPKCIGINSAWLRSI